MLFKDTKHPVNIELENTLTEVVSEFKLLGRMIWVGRKVMRNFQKVQVFQHF